MTDADGADRGRFITFEGGEGAGKSTQIRRLAEAIQAAGRGVLVTREPGGTGLGERIRELLVTGQPDAMSAHTELLLVMAARIEHLRQVIHPALARGEWVLCDRFADSTLAYQGHGRGLALADLTWLHGWGCRAVKPDLTLLLDLDPLVGLARAAPGGGAMPETRFEEEDLAFHRRVRAGFLALAAAEPERFRIIDAGRDADRVATAVREAVRLALLPTMT